MKEYIKKPIPEIPSVAGWKEESPIECGEPLVPLGLFSPEYNDFFTDAIYFSQNKTTSPYVRGELDEALLTIFVREGVAKRLRILRDSLPEGYELLIWDGYRPDGVQSSIYQDFFEQVKAKHPEWSDEQASEYAQKFVSIPNFDQNPSAPSPHSTGGSVDMTFVKIPDDKRDELKKLNAAIRSDDWKISYEAQLKRHTLIRDHAVPINMGVGFDEVGPDVYVDKYDGAIRLADNVDTNVFDADPNQIATNKTYARYYEILNECGADMSANDVEAMHNRRLFYHLALVAGFNMYGDEPWHIDAGNGFAHMTGGQDYIYGKIYLSEDNLEHEQMRLEHELGHEALLADVSVKKKIMVPDFSEAGQLKEIVRDAAKANGSVRIMGAQHTSAYRLEAA